MSKTQFWILNGTAALLVVLLFGHFLYARSNNRFGQEIARDRLYVNNARQLEMVSQQLTSRIAQEAASEPQLRTLLAKYGIQIAAAPPKAPAQATPPASRPAR
jgi:hypothetical protein